MAGENKGSKNIVRGHCKSSWKRWIMVWTSSVKDKILGYILGLEVPGFVDKLH